MQICCNVLIQCTPIVEYLCLVLRKIQTKLSLTMLFLFLTQLVKVTKNMSAALFCYADLILDQSFHFMSMNSSLNLSVSKSK